MTPWGLKNILTIGISCRDTQGIFIVTPSIEVWLTKAKEAPSPHKVRLTPLDSNPVFHSMSESTEEFL